MGKDTRSHARKPSTPPKAAKKKVAKSREIAAPPPPPDEDVAQVSAPAQEEPPDVDADSLTPAAEATADEKSDAGSALNQAGDQPMTVDVEATVAELENLREQLAERDQTIADLTAQLNTANLRADQAEAKAGEQVAWAQRQAR